MKNKLNGAKLEKFKKAVKSSKVSEGIKRGKIIVSKFEQIKGMEIKEDGDLNHITLSNEQVSHILIDALEDAGVPLDLKAPIGVGWYKDDVDVNKNQITISFMNN